MKSSKAVQSHSFTLFGRQGLAVMGGQKELQQCLHLLRSTPVVPAFADIPMCLTALLQASPHLADLGTSLQDLDALVQSAVWPQICFLVLRLLPRAPAAMGSCSGIPRSLKFQLWTILPANFLLSWAMP